MNFLKTTLLGGLYVLLPLMLLWIGIKEVGALLVELATPIAGRPARLAGNRPPNDRVGQSAARAGATIADPPHHPLTMVSPKCRHASWRSGAGGADLANPVRRRDRQWNFRARNC